MTVPNAGGRYPVAPKAWGGMFGAGAGNTVAIVAIGLIQQYTGPLSTAWQDAIFAGATIAVSMLGAYLAPHQQRPGG